MSYAIPDQRTKETWKGIPSLTIYRNASSLDLTNAYIEMQVRTQYDAPAVITFSSTNGGIIISNPTQGFFYFPPQVINAPIGNYVWDLKVTLQTGEIKTFWSGTWKINPTITKS